MTPRGIRASLATAAALVVVAVVTWLLGSDGGQASIAPTIPSGGAAPRAPVSPPQVADDAPEALHRDDPPAPLRPVDARPDAGAAVRGAPPGVRRVTGRLLRLVDRTPLADVDVGSGKDSARTDADGRFALRAVPDEDELLVGYAPFSERLVPITPGSEDLDLGDVVVDSGWTLAGHVVDIAGAPVAGATVRVLGLREDVSAVDGSFVLRDVPNLDSSYSNRKASVVRMDVTASWFVDTRQDVRLPEPERSVPGLRLVMAPTGAIVGKVTGPGGAPRAGIEVRSVVHVDDAVGTSSVLFEVETDARGAYRIDGLTPGAHVLEVGPSRWDEYHGTNKRTDAERPIPARVLVGPAVVSPAATTRVDVALPAVGGITGRVTDAAGAPLDGVSVKVWSVTTWAVGGPARGSDVDRFVDEDGQLHMSRLVDLASSDAAGRFRVLDVAPGTFRLEAETSRPGEAHRIVRTVDVPEAADAVVELAFGAGPAVRVEVVDEQGGLVRDARVMLLAANGDEAVEGGGAWGAVPRRRLRVMMAAGETGLRVDETGRFTFSGLDEDRDHDLVVAAPGRSSVLVRGVRPDPATRRVVLEPERVLAFRVLDADTMRPLDRALVTWLAYGPRTREHGETVVEDGRLVVPDLPDEAFTVELSTGRSTTWLGEGLVPRPVGEPPVDVVLELVD